MLYTFRCEVCKNQQVISFNLHDAREAECCGILMKRIINSLGAQVAPKHQAAGDKLAYYGISNVVTGEGITENTILTETCGIRVK